MVWLELLLRCDTLGERKIQKKIVNIDSSVVQSAGANFVYYYSDLIHFNCITVVERGYCGDANEC